MAVFTDINRDKYGVVRGRCKDCPEECPQYSQPVLRHNCTYCGCPAGQHERVEPRPELIIKTEPGEEEARSPGRRDGRPTPGPSRRPDGWTTVPPQPGPSRRNESPHRDESRTVIQVVRRYLRMRVSSILKLRDTSAEQKRGVFTILWKGKIIYVGDPKKTPILTCLRSIFNGGSNQDISKCLKNLRNDLKRAHVRIAWLKHKDDDPHLKTCREGKKGLSYRQCLSNLQGEKPRDVLKGLMREETINL
ncbi:uncharacterized protein LOC124283492 [Haliotis rubra]|uniref:uncharacterized protein LOC124283492 n=1 Tax=Haliotis rubra TaxID=36100 RepID=UPI001EE5296A|nr:uncharacterized protein LOC124283492 [Haliotis rubra]